MGFGREINSEKMYSLTLV